MPSAAHSADQSASNSEDLAMAVKSRHRRLRF